MHLCTLFFVSLICSSGFAYIPNILHPFQSALIKLNDYDSTARPPGVGNEDDPVHVTASIFLWGIDSLDYETNEFRFHVILREAWTDARLTFTGYDKDITTSEVNLFWKPDIFFPNEVDGQIHTLTKPNTYIRIKGSGEIRLSSRLAVTIKCPMFLEAFPFDTQRCPIIMESYGYTTNDLDLHWKEENPFQISNSLFFGEYTLREVVTSNGTSLATTGAFAKLSAELVFERNPMPYIVRVFLPIFALVVASWVPFWLPSSPAVRFTVSGFVTLVTTILTLYEKQYLCIPTFTVLDFWLSISTFFVYLAFFQFLLLIYRNSKKYENKIQKADDIEFLCESTKILWITFESDVPCVDAVSRVFFPGAYMLFNVFFFIFVSTFYI